jgi:hypothetical protein
VTSAGETEHYILVCSRKPLPDLEDVLAKMEPARFGHPIQYPPVNPGAIQALRGTSGLVLSDRPSTAEVDSLIGRIAELTAHREKQRGVWVRRIDLENPAH